MVAGSTDKATLGLAQVEQVFNGEVHVASINSSAGNISRQHESHQAQGGFSNPVLVPSPAAIGILHAFFSEAGKAIVDCGYNRLSEPRDTNALSRLVLGQACAVKDCKSGNADSEAIN